MNICVLTAYGGDKYKSVGPATSYSKFLYSTAHKYSFICYNNSDLIYPYPLSWFKIDAIKRLLDSFDWIFWSDADVLITNPNITLESLINCKVSRNSTIRLSPVDKPESFNCPELVTTDYIISQDAFSPCMGNFLIKNSDWSRNFIDSILDLRYKFAEDPLWENRAQDYLFANNPDMMRNVKFVPQKHLNSLIFQWSKEDFLIHFAATERHRMEQYVIDYTKLSRDTWTKFNEKANQ